MPPNHPHVRYFLPNIKMMKRPMKYLRIISMMSILWGNGHLCIIILHQNVTNKMLTSTMKGNANHGN
jgi:hypothetical protein